MILITLVVLDALIFIILFGGLCHRVASVVKKGSINSDDFAIIFKNLSFHVIVCFPFLQEYAVYHNELQLYNDAYTHSTIAYKVVCIAFTCVAVWHTEKGN